MASNQRCSDNICIPSEVLIADPLSFAKLDRE